MTTFEEALKKLLAEGVQHDLFDEAARDTTTPWLPSPPVPDTEESESRGVPQNLVGAGYDAFLSEEQRAYAPLNHAPLNHAPLATPADAPLPSDASERQHVPLHSGLVKYFPDALVAIADLSWRGNEQHNPGQPLHWSREKSSDHEDCLMRHHFEAGTFDKDGVRHSTKRAWRALAALQLEIEASR